MGYLIIYFWGSQFQDYINMAGEFQGDGNFGGLRYWDDFLQAAPELAALGIFLVSIVPHSAALERFWSNMGSMGTSNRCRLGTERHVKMAILRAEINQEQNGKKNERMSAEDMRQSKWFPKPPTVELHVAAVPFVPAANPPPFDPLHLHGPVPPPMNPADADTTFVDPTEEEVVMDEFNLATLTDGSAGRRRGRRLGRCGERDKVQLREIFMASGDNALPPLTIRLPVM